MSSSLFLGLSITKSGFEGDGVFTGIVGVIILLIVIFHKGSPGKIYSWPVSVLSIIAGIVVIFSALNVIAFEPESSEIIASPGVGLCLTPIGALFSIIGGFLSVPVPPTELLPPQMPPQSADHIN